MRWHVQAEGDAPGDTHRDLADRLGKLLGMGKFGTDASHFSGEQVNGPVHGPAPDPEPDPEPDPAEGSGET